MLVVHRRRVLRLETFCNLKQCFHDGPFGHLKFVEDADCKDS